MRQISATAFCFLLVLFCKLSESSRPAILGATLDPSDSAGPLKDESAGNVSDEHAPALASVSVLEGDADVGDGFMGDEITKPYVHEFECVYRGGGRKRKYEVCSGPRFTMASSKDWGDKGTIVREPRRGSRRGDALFEHCRTRTTKPNGKNSVRSCCRSSYSAAEGCYARVRSSMKIELPTSENESDFEAENSSSNHDERKYGVEAPYIGPEAKLMEYILHARYSGERFVYSPSSRYDPREEPVISACSAFLRRIKRIIRDKRLQLLLRFDPRGYFDVFRQFDTSKRFDPGLQSALIADIFGRKVSQQRASQIWDTWIDQNGSEALIDGDPDGRDKMTDEKFAALLDEMLEEAYNALEDVGDDVTVIQTSEMSRGVKSRRKQTRLRKYGVWCVVILGGIAVASSGGLLAAPVVAGAGLAYAMMKIPESFLNHRYANANRQSADMFGQTYKQLRWLSYMREWVKNWMDIDLVEAFEIAKPRMKIKDKVEKQLLCKHGHPSCVFKGARAEVELKMSFLSNLINLVMIDGGCREETDLMSQAFFAGKPEAFFGQQRVHARCCVKEGGNMFSKFARAQCMAVDDHECPSEWKTVAPEMSFDDEEDDWGSVRYANLQKSTQTCCGAYTGDSKGKWFYCGVNHCASDFLDQGIESRRILRDRKCGRGQKWQDENDQRTRYCKARGKYQDECVRAAAFASCRSRKSFCNFFATSKARMTFFVFKAMRHCIRDLPSFSNQ